jgi:hypothetical protein
MQSLSSATIPGRAAQSMTTCLNADVSFTFADVSASSGMGMPLKHLCIAYDNLGRFSSRQCLVKTVFRSLRVGSDF